MRSGGGGCGVMAPLRQRVPAKDNEQRPSNPEGWETPDRPCSLHDEEPYRSADGDQPAGQLTNASPKDSQEQTDAKTNREHESHGVLPQLSNEGTVPYGDSDADAPQEASGQDVRASDYPSNPVTTTKD